jgi:hypothetical protein
MIVVSKTPIGDQGHIQSLDWAVETASSGKSRYSSQLKVHFVQLNNFPAVRRGEAHVQTV